MVLHIGLGVFIVFIEYESSTCIRVINYIEMIYPVLPVNVTLPECFRSVALNAAEFKFSLRATLFNITTCNPFF